MPDRDRDRSVEHVLRRVLSDSESVSTQSPCVDGETLAAWTSGSLHAEQAAAIESHVAGCARCQSMMAAFVQTEPVVPATESIWRRWRLGWLVPLATAATAAALWIALPGNSTLPSPTDTARSTVARDQQSPAAASTPSPAPPALESTAQTARLRQERGDALAGNEARKQKEEIAKQVEEETAASRERLEERLAVAAPAAPAAAPPPPAEAEADRRDLKANSSAQAFAARAAAAPGEIVAPGGAARWRIVDGRQVERSTSAGGDWVPLNVDSPDVLASGAALSPSVCWIVGRRGAVYLTTDGMRFERLPFPEMADLVSVTAVDDRTATVSSVDGRLWRTVDQGRTWSPGR